MVALLICQLYTVFHLCDDDDTYRSPVNKKIVFPKSRKYKIRKDVGLKMCGSLNL